MVRRKAKRVRRNLTPEERKRLDRLREQTEAEKAEIIAAAKRFRQARRAARARMRETMKHLRAARIAKGLTLRQLEQQTGIARSNLSRLENDSEPNPTIETLSRYAEALGKTLQITLVDG